MPFCGFNCHFQNYRLKNVNNRKTRAIKIIILYFMILVNALGAFIISL